MSGPLKAITQFKCPRCRKGNLFTYTNAYRIKGYFDMPEKCTVCGQSYLLEPGFYYGAMYVNYGVTIALSVATFFAMYVLGRPWEMYAYLIGIAAVLLLSAPYTFRLARSIWIYFFVPFEQESVTEDK